MTRTNKLYGIALISIVVVSICFFYSIYVSNYFYKNKTSDVYYGTNESSLGFGDLYDTLDEVEEHIGLEPLKEYEVNDNVYILVSKGLELFDDRVLCYKYDTVTKRLYRVWGNYCSIYKLHTNDGDWYEDEFVFNLMDAMAGRGHYIPQDTKNTDVTGDVFYGVWFGDEVKNISFEKGKFEYSFLGKKENGCNVYFWTYELKDSQNILKEVVRVENKQHNDHYYKYKYYCLDDVASLLGIDCKMTIDERIIVYWVITLIFFVTFVLISYRTFDLNKTKGKVVIKAIFWTISFILCIVVTLLIVYYINNPRLYFGVHGVREFVQNLTGYSLPNTVTE
jgi:hypothetical protein